MFFHIKMLFFSRISHIHSGYKKLAGVFVCENLRSDFTVGYGNEKTAFLRCRRTPKGI